MIFRWFSLVLFFCLLRPVVGQDVVDSLQLRLRQPLDSTELGDTYHRLGNAFGDLGNVPAAAAATAKALDIRLIQENNYPDKVLVSAYNLGVLQFELRQYQSATGTFQLILDRAPNRKAAVTYFQLGRTYGTRQEYTLAEEAFIAAANLPPFSEDEDLYGILISEWSAIYLEQDQADKAQRAIAIINQYLADYQPTSSDQLVLQYNRLGLAYTYAHEYQLAEAAYQKALNINRNCCGSDERESEILINRGLNFRRAGQLVKAEQLQLRALKLNLALANHQAPDGYVALNYNNLASLYYYRGELKKSEQYATQALAWLLPAYSPATLGAAGIDTLTKQANLPTLLTLVADLARTKNARAAAPRDSILALYYFCDRLIDELHRSQQLEDSKLSWRSSALNIYAEAVKAASAANDPAAAFYFSEKSRAIIFLNDQLKRTALQQLPPAVQTELRQLAGNLNFWRVNRGYQQELLLNQQYYHSLLDSLGRAYPSSYWSNRKLPQPALQKTQAALDPQEVLVEYFLHDSTCVALVIRKKTAAIIPLSTLPTLRTTARRYREALHSNDQAFPVGPARTLYEQLVAPLSVSPSDRLIIVADDFLQTLPLAALLTDSVAAEVPYAKWPWFGGQYAWTRAWSAQLHQLSRARPTTVKKILYFAPATAQGIDGIADSLLLPLSKASSPPIPLDWSVNVRIGATADRSYFQNKSDQYDLIHLATHGYLGQGTAPPYFLVADAHNNRYTAADLSFHQLSAQLVTLSACQTGLGEVQYGEGIASLGRAFARSGAAGVTFSLWPIDEQASVDVFSHFYPSIAEGEGRSSALHRAQQTYLQQQSNNQLAHPFRWAGLVYYGPDTPLQIITPAPWWQQWWVVLCLIGGIAGWLVWRFRWSIS
ncbi:MAG: CHAT domain-containing tetratricopeptide repeat protein [Bacteroidota bacterium]